MTLEQLRVFVAVVEHGSIRAGARALDMAQSGLTQQIKRLEAAVGATLFRRAHSGISLTDHGTALLARARVILAECAHAEQDFRFLRGELSGTVQLGMSVEAFGKLVPPVLAQFRAAHPRVLVHIASGTAELLLARLREGKLDFAITHGADTADLAAAPIFRADPCIMCRRGHPLEQASSVQDLVQAEWVGSRPMGPGTPSNRLADWFAGQGLPPPRVVATLESALHTLHLVGRSDYLFLGPRVVLERGDYSRSIAVLQVAEPLPRSDMCLLQRRSAPLSAPARELSAMLVSYAQMLGRRQEAEELASAE